MPSCRRRASELLALPFTPTLSRRSTIMAERCRAHSSIQEARNSCDGDANSPLVDPVIESPVSSRQALSKPPRWVPQYLLARAGGSSSEPLQAIDNGIVQALRHYARLAEHRASLIQTFTSAAEQVARARSWQENEPFRAHQFGSVCDPQEEGKQHQRAASVSQSERTSTPQASVRTSPLASRRLSTPPLPRLRPHPKSLEEVRRELVEGAFGIIRTIRTPTVQTPLKRSEDAVPDEPLAPSCTTDSADSWEWTEVNGPSQPLPSILVAQIHSSIEAIRCTTIAAATALLRAQRLLMEGDGSHSASCAFKPYVTAQLDEVRKVWPFQLHSACARYPEVLRIVAFPLYGNLWLDPLYGDVTPPPGDPLKTIPPMPFTAASPTEVPRGTTVERAHKKVPLRPLRRYVCCPLWTQKRKGRASQ